MQRFLIICLALLTCAGCKREPTLLSQIQNAGGLPALKRECLSLLEDHQKLETTSSKPPHPPIIAALNPQIVQVRTYNGLPMVDIQISGGFSHRGLMIVLTNTPSDFMPRKSSWRITKIAEGIYEYRE